MEVLEIHGENGVWDENSAVLGHLGIFLMGIQEDLTKEHGEDALKNVKDHTWHEHKHITYMYCGKLYLSPDFYSHMYPFKLNTCQR